MSTKDHNETLVGIHLFVGSVFTLGLIGSPRDHRTKFQGRGDDSSGNTRLWNSVPGRGSYVLDGHCNAAPKTGWSKIGINSRIDNYLLAGWRIQLVVLSQRGRKTDVRY